MKKFLSTILVFTLFLTQSLPPALAAKVAWETKLDDKISWSQVTYFGTLLIGSNTSLASYNPETGELMWKRDDLNKIAPFDVREVRGLPIIILGLDRVLGGMKTQLESINMATGETLWKTDTINGQPLGVYTIPEKNLALLVINEYMNSSKEGESNGVYVRAYNAQTGEMTWKTLYTNKAAEIPLHLADNAGTFYPRTDLSGHQDPTIDGNLVYFPFSGVAAFDLTTGEMKWSHEFRTAHKTYKKAYAPIIVEGDMVYATGSGVVYAINKTNGEIKWQTEKVKSGLIAQLIVADDMVLARLGGNFFNQGGKAFVLDKPLGVMSYNKIDGTNLWEYKGASGGITNLVYLPEQHTVFFADASKLIGIDSQSTGQVKEAFTLPVKFKRSIGMTDMASGGVKALTGGIGGLLNAGAKMAVGKERRDDPVAVTKQSNGTVVVRGKQHLLSFNPGSQEIVWSNYFAAPAVSGFGVAMMLAATAFSTFAANAQYAAGQTSMSGASDNIKKGFARMDRYLDKRFSKSKSTEKYSFVLTNVEEGTDKGVGILVVDMETGETFTQKVLDEKDPEYIIDEVTGRLYFFPKKHSIEAIDLTGE